MEKKGQTLGRRMFVKRGLNLGDRTKEKDRNGRGRHVEGSGWAVGELAWGLDSGDRDERKGTDSRRDWLSIRTASEEIDHKKVPEGVRRFVERSLWWTTWTNRQCT
jgi:hypothetical protein